MKHFDAIVIGSGAGTKLVRPVADLGKRVAIIERESPGGTCLNRGCIPSKMLIYPADLIHETQDLSRLQLHREGTWKVDFSRLVDRINDTVENESSSIPPLYEKHPRITYYNQHARLVGDKEVEVGEERITADTIFIATGARPYVPDIEGLSSTPYWTSREALKNRLLPKRLVVYGGGYVGVELGMAYAAFGTEVCFVVRSHLLREEDHEIRDLFLQAIQSKVKIYQNTTIRRVEYENRMFRIELSDSQKTILESDALLIATGIKPNTDDLGIESTGIALDNDGFILTNQFLETSVPGIYAFGDVIGRHFFRHTANFEGEYLFRNLYRHAERAPIHYPPIPHAVFSYPELASVGLTEEACRMGGFDYVKAVHPYSESAMGMARLPEYGIVKILVDKTTGKLLGAHILGDEASSLIHILILGMTMGCRWEDYLHMIYIHPALPEVIRNAFRKIEGEMSKNCEPSK